MAADKLTSEEDLITRRFVADPSGLHYTEALMLRTGYKAGPVVARPANTTAYTAGDVVGGATQGAIELQNIGPDGGAIFVRSVDLTMLLTSLPPGIGAFTAHFYDAPPPSNLADNAPWSLPAGDVANYLGSIAMGAPALVGGTPYVQTDNINKQFHLQAGQTSLWIYLVTGGAYTPGNGDQIRPRFRAQAV